MYPGEHYNLHAKPKNKPLSSWWRQFRVRKAPGYSVYWLEVRYIWWPLWDKHTNFFGSNWFISDKEAEQFLKDKLQTAKPPKPLTIKKL
jgi:hypothetical protein